VLPEQQAVLQWIHPGHLPQTSFSQPGGGVYFPDSSPSSRKAGFSFNDSFSVNSAEPFVFLELAKIYFRTILYHHFACLPNRSSQPIRPLVCHLPACI
jgi:hypothetical protein